MKTLRKNNFTEKCLELHSKYGGPDQYIINLYTFAKHELLETRFNIFAHREYGTLTEYDDFILHYEGVKKPWLGKHGKYDQLWNEFKVDIK